MANPLISSDYSGSVPKQKAIVEFGPPPSTNLVFLSDRENIPANPIFIVPTFDGIVFIYYGIDHDGCSWMCHVLMFRSISVDLFEFLRHLERQAITYW